MKKINLGSNGRKHVEWKWGRFFFAYNEFVDVFPLRDKIGFWRPPRTAGVTLLRLWRFEIGYW